MKHFALPERGVFVHLVLNLTVGVIQAARQCGRLVSVHQRAPGHNLLGQLAAPGMAAGAGFDFLVRDARGAAARVAGSRIDGPVNRVALVELHHQPVARYLVPARLALGPDQMPRTRAMTGLA